MNNEVAKKILEILGDLKKERERLTNDYSRLVKDVQILTSEVSNISSKMAEIEVLLNNLSKEQEKHKNLIKTLNEKVSLQDSKIYSNEKDKKVLSSLVFDLHNLKNEMTKEIEILKNKAVLLESSVNMKKIDTSSLKTVENSINEIKDIIRISTQSINAKVNDVYTRIEKMEMKQKLHELMLRIATTPNKSLIEEYLDDILDLIKKIRVIEDDRNLIETILNYFDDMSSFWNNAGDKDMAQIFDRKKREIQIM